MSEPSIWSDQPSSVRRRVRLDISRCGVTGKTAWPSAHGPPGPESRGDCYPARNVLGTVLDLAPAPSPRRADPSLPAKIKGIFTATKTHALNLAKFVTIYKVLLLVQKRINGGKERDMDSLIAGGLGGWWCFGQRTPVSGA